ncbi:DUF6270 domain-containing protein [Luteococcus sp. Sow4_B9]|uniref:DUF6270 domain-containing protein n=1 Tax=Luteococcus sp. Sow4_B9 TaxID=3438792 RepID=UPI003F95FA24
MDETQRSDARTRLAVAGSCVSRDTVACMDPAGHELQCYVARQSLLSWGSDATHHLPPGVPFANQFQQKQVEGDFAGDLTDRLQEVADSVDVLLIDLCDERHGVVRMHDGSYVTKSIDVVTNDGLSGALECGRVLPLGSDEHFHAWSHAADRFVSWLRTSGLLERTLLVTTPWAVTSSDGSAVPGSMGIIPEQANALYPRYHTHLETLGLRSVSSAAPQADPEHRWGLAAFHYTPEVYAEIANEVITMATAAGRRQV